MQKLFILTSWFLIVYGIYNKLGKNSILIVLSISWWFFWNLISSFSISGLHPPGNKYQFILFIFFYSLLIGIHLYDKVIILPFVKLYKINFENLNRERYLYFFLLFVILPISSHFLYRTYLLLSTKYSQALFRSEVFGLNTGSSELFYNNNIISSLYWLIIHPIYWMSLIVGMIYFIKYKRIRILFIAIIFFIMDSLTTNGRFGIHYILITIMTLSILTLIEKNIKYFYSRNTFIIIFITFILIFLLFYIRKANDLRSLQYYVIGYHTCSFSIMNVELNDPNSIIYFKTLGASFWGGSLNLPRFLSNLIGVKWIGEVDIIGGYLHANRLVGFDSSGNPWYHNAFGSIFFSIYRDAGHLGSIIYGLLFGYLMATCSKSLQNKNSFLLGTLITIYFILIYGIFQPFTSGSILPAYFLVILYFLIPPINFKKND